MNRFTIYAVVIFCMFLCSFRNAAAADTDTVITLTKTELATSTAKSKAVTGGPINNNNIKNTIENTIDGPDLDDYTSAPATQTNDKYSLDTGTAFFRGFDLNFDGDNAYELTSFAFGLGDYTDGSNRGYEGCFDEPIVAVVTGRSADGTTKQVTTGICAGFAKLGGDNGDDPPYAWSSYLTGVLFDSSTLMTKRLSNVQVRCSNDENGYCEESVEIDVKSELGAKYNSNDYLFIANLDRVVLQTSCYLGMFGCSYGAEDLAAAVWIHNNESHTNVLDYDDDNKTGSNGMDHYVGTDGKLKLHVSINFNGPNEIPNNWARVAVNLIAIKKDVWGIKWFGWDEDNDSACESDSTVSADGIIDKNHAFVVPYSLGVNSSQDETREFDRVYNYVKLDEVDSDSGTAKIKMSGCIKGHKGVDTSADSFHLNANETKGYLIYCKDSSACRTSQQNFDEHEGEGEGSKGDTVDKATVIIDI